MFDDDSWQNQVKRYLIFSAILFAIVVFALLISRQEITFESILLLAAVCLVGPLIRGLGWAVIAGVLWFFSEVIMKGIMEPLDRYLDKRARAQRTR